MQPSSKKNMSKSSHVEESHRSSRRRSSKNKKGLKVDTKHANGIYSNKNNTPATPDTAASTPDAKTPAGRRGSKDLRSPGIAKTPVPDGVKIAPPDAPLPDFITQTDGYGNPITPRSEDAIESARVEHPSGPKPALHVDQNGQLTEDPAKESDDEDACDSILDNFRMMCCCLGPEHTAAAKPETTTKEQQQSTVSEVSQENKIERVKLLPGHHPDDKGKKCLVLDLDETLVHSSFRAVPGADFVIPVQVRICANYRTCIAMPKYYSETHVSFFFLSCETD